MTGATGNASGDVAFRPVLMADVPMLTRWLGEPHVRRFYQKAPITRDEVAAEYGPTIRGETPDIVHLALSNGAPFGYIQCYRNADYPDWADVIDVHDGISVDFFVGEPRCLGQGFGRVLLGGFLQRIAFPHFRGRAAGDNGARAGQHRRRALLAIGRLPLRARVFGGRRPDAAARDGARPDLRLAL
jgi:hypothetical protein